MLANLSHNKVVCFTLLLPLVICGCLKANKFSHSPAMAARQAQLFAQTAFVERNLPSAYGMLSANTKRDLAFEQFKDEIVKMHATKYPDLVKPVEYEPIPGLKEMNIYLVGEAGPEKFYYRFVMEGTLDDDYQVVGVWRNDGPYPPAGSVKTLDSSQR